MRPLVVLGLIALIALALSVNAMLVLDTAPTVPACAEDEVIVGVGDFHPSGLWDAYRCEHPDNL